MKKLLLLLALLAAAKSTQAQSFHFTSMCMNNDTIPVSADLILDPIMGNSLFLGDMQYCFSNDEITITSNWRPGLNNMTHIVQFIPKIHDWYWGTSITFFNTLELEGPPRPSFKPQAAAK